MNRAVVYIVNLALGAVCCWLVAGVVMAVAASVVEAEVAETAPVASAPPQARSWDERQAILTRNLFDASTLAPATTQVIEEERYTKTKLALRLLGTAASSIPQESRAAVEDLTLRKHQVVWIGATIQGATVVAIDPRRIVLENRGRREELALEEEPVTARPIARRSPTRPPRSVQRLAANRFAVDREKVDELRTNPQALFSQARIIPSYDRESGQMTGLQLNAIKAGSLFEQAGLQNGDVVTSLNGIEANSTQNSQQLLNEFRSSSEWSLTVRDRDGTERSIDFVGD